MAMVVLARSPPVVSPLYPPQSQQNEECSEDQPWSNWIVGTPNHHHDHDEDDHPDGRRRQLPLVHTSTVFFRFLDGKVCMNEYI